MPECKQRRIFVLSLLELRGFYLWEKFFECFFYHSVTAVYIYVLIFLEGMEKCSVVHEEKIGSEQRRCKIKDIQEILQF